MPYFLQHSTSLYEARAAIPLRLSHEEMLAYVADSVRWLVDVHTVTVMFEHRTDVYVWRELSVVWKHDIAKWNNKTRFRAINQVKDEV